MERTQIRRPVAVVFGSSKSKGVRLSLKGDLVARHQHMPLFSGSVCECERAFVERALPQRVDVLFPLWSRHRFQPDRRVSKGFLSGIADDGSKGVVHFHIVMPNSEGLETIRSLRRLDAAVKIVASSGGGSGRADDYLALAHKLGATRILAKPFSGDEIVAVVAEVLAAPSDVGSLTAIGQ